MGQLSRSSSYWLAVDCDIGICHPGHVLDNARRNCNVRESAVDQIDGPDLVAGSPRHVQHKGRSVDGHMVDIDIVEARGKTAAASMVVESSEKGCPRDARRGHVVHVDVLDESALLQVGFEVQAISNAAAKRRQAMGIDVLDS